MQNENLLQDSVKSAVETAMGVSAGQIIAIMDAFYGQE